MMIHLSGSWTLLIDFIVWLFIHVGVSVSLARIPADSFNPEAWLFRERGWERNGRIYNTLLRVKAWKKLLPDGAAVSKNGFRKKRLQNSDAIYMRQFVLETCRAELVHVVIFVFALVFFIWNEWWIGIIMIAYAFVVNIPCVVTQRYNRIRMRRIYKQDTMPQKGDEPM